MDQLEILLALRAKQKELDTLKSKAQSAENAMAGIGRELKRQKQIAEDSWADHRYCADEIRELEKMLLTFEDHQ